MTAPVPARTDGLFVEVGRKRYQIQTYKQASDMWCRARDQHGGGASEIPGLNIVTEAGAVVAHVSYNGRVWAGPCGNWKPGAVPLYDNSSGLPPLKAGRRAS